VYPQMIVAGSGAAASPSSGDPFVAACGTSNPGIACRLVWDLTHSTSAADLTRVYLAGPAQIVIRIGFVVLIALVIRLAAHRAIRRVTARAAKDSSNGTDRAHGLLFGERRQQRAAALGSILSNAASLTIFGIAAVIILGDMGLNLAPLLASTAVLGVALGFGAQNLVQDFLAGIFMLVEDQYGVGDVIDVGGTSGTVEAVSLRITSLRDVNGVVWHVRNGTIPKSGNKSQGWARAVIDFPVPYRHDIPQVRQVMAQTATAMWQEPAWNEIILEEPEVWGVQTLYTDAVLLRVVARTVPLRQWEVQRELMERLKSALDATGVADGSGVVSATEASSGAVVPAGAQPLAHPPSPAAAPPSPATAQGTLGDASAPQPPHGAPGSQPGPGGLPHPDRHLGPDGLIRPDGQ
jgi:moderate conductance mechanosensitive channel